MPLKIVKRYTEEDAKSERNILVFGDNLVGIGKGGQAAVARDAKRSVGIPTKIFPGTEESAYLSDEHFPYVKHLIDQSFEQIVRMLVLGNIVLFPEDGVGTGLAELPTRAPRIHGYIQRKTDALIALYT